MTTELKLRIRTAIIMVVVVIFLLFFASNIQFQIALSLVMAVAAWEWASFAKLTKASAKGLYVGLVLLGILGSLWLTAEMLEILLFVSAGAWVVALLAIPFFPNYGAWFYRSKVLVLTDGVLVLVSAWVAIVLVGELGGSSRVPLLLFLMFIWLADIGAYFAGRKFGKHKLMPNVSPGKTLQGFFGGLLAVLVFGTVVSLSTGKFSLGFLLVLVAVVIFSVVGDLMESCYKRTAGMKDSGTILPGHGGIMDRIDSLVAAAPIYYVASLLV